MASLRPFTRRVAALLDHWTVAIALTAVLHGGLVAAGAWPRRYEAPPAAFSLTVLRGPPLGYGPGGSGPGGVGSGGGGYGPGTGEAGEDDTGVGSPVVTMPRRATTPGFQQAEEPAEPPPTLPAAQILPGGTAGAVPIPVDRSGERREVLSAVERQQKIRAALSAAGAVSAERGGGGRGGGGGGGWGFGGGGGGWGGGGDPELWRWQAEVEGLFRDTFHPIVPTGAALPAGGAHYLVDFDAESGDVVGWEPYRSSGNAAYDAAVERAIRAVPRVPLPPPQYRDAVGTRLVVEFLPP